MKLTLWTYEGPPHVGAMRVATAMEGVHYVLHAPQGDTYADLLFTMIERRSKRPPVTYTTFQARDLGGDTAELFKTAAREAYERFKPQAMLVGASCTAELIQDDPGGLARALNLPVPVVAIELPAYQRKENWGAAETFYRLVRAFADPPAQSLPRQPSPAQASPAQPSPAQPSPAQPSPAQPSPAQPSPAQPSPAQPSPAQPSRASGSGGAAARASTSGMSGDARGEGRRPRCNLLGPTALGFRHRDDVTEVRGLLDRLGIDVAVVAPLGASPADLARLGEADFNIALYPEIALPAAQWLQRRFGQPLVKTVPIGVGATHDFIAEVARIAGVDASGLLAAEQSRLPWYSRSVDSTYLTGKRVFIFADATHAVAAARIAADELGFTVVGLGTYTRELAREVRDAAAHYGVEPLITDDYLEVEAQVAALQPELVLGTQMERHIAKRLGIPCAVISAPVHVQDFPARYAPQMGFEGANVLFDTWIHPLMMGLEEHLLGMFRDDFEFNDETIPSHLGAPTHLGAPAQVGAPSQVGTRSQAETQSSPDEVVVQAPVLIAQPVVAWNSAAEQELKKIPFFVRGKARRNTERFAFERGITAITVETLYDAKAHFGR